MNELSLQQHVHRRRMSHEKEEGLAARCPHYIAGGTPSEFAPRTRVYDDNVLATVKLEPFTNRKETV